jgi:hypothetical protein
MLSCNSHFLQLTIMASQFQDHDSLLDALEEETQLELQVETEAGKVEGSAATTDDGKEELKPKRPRVELDPIIPMKIQGVMNHTCATFAFSCALCYVR